MKGRVFKQGRWTGLCGPYAILNALSLLRLGSVGTTDPIAFARGVTRALAGGFEAVVREGTDRAQMDVMLAEARSWTARQGQPDWTWDPRHPVPETETADEVWAELGRTLACGDAAVIVGFGDDTLRDSRYEPHWTCVERIEPRRIRLRDSDAYEAVARARTAVRPQPGWEIEDCFVLRKA